MYRAPCSNVQLGRQGLLQTRLRYGRTYTEAWVAMSHHAQPCGKQVQMTTTASIHRFLSSPGFYLTFSMKQNIWLLVHRSASPRRLPFPLLAWVLCVILALTISILYFPLWTWVSTVVTITLHLGIDAVKYRRVTWGVHRNYTFRQTQDGLPWRKTIYQSLGLGGFFARYVAAHRRLLTGP